MFGFMQFHNCVQGEEERQKHVLHYCGTCKTIGSLYGQAARFFLNTDAVFLSELLTALSSIEMRWDSSYFSYNCMAVPERKKDLPLPLEISASCNVLLAELKLADKAIDTRSMTASVGQWVFSDAFEQARINLHAMGFPVERLIDLAEQQKTREDCGLPAAMPIEMSLAYFAEVTAEITETVFRSATRAIGRDEKTCEIMAELGRQFGTMIYLLDAYDDYERDTRRGEFNAIAATNRAVTVSAEESKDIVATHIRRTAARAKQAMRRLPLPEDLRAKFAERLQKNLAGKLPSHSCSHQRKATHRQALTPSTVKPRFASLGVRSFKDNLELPLNFMFWGAVAGTLSRVPRLALANLSGGTGDDEHAGDREKRRHWGWKGRGSRKTDNSAASGEPGRRAANADFGDSSQGNDQNRERQYSGEYAGGQNNGPCCEKCQNCAQCDGKCCECNCLSRRSHDDTRYGAGPGPGGQSTGPEDTRADDRTRRRRGPGASSVCCPGCCVCSCCDDCACCAGNCADDCCYCNNGCGRPYRTWRCCESCCSDPSGGCCCDGDCCGDSSGGCCGDSSGGCCGHSGGCCGDSSGGCCGDSSGGCCADSSGGCCGDSSGGCCDAGGCDCGSCDCGSCDCGGCDCGGCGN